MNKDTPFRCYFCSKIIINDTEIGHTSQCGFVLESCPNKCGSYIQRNVREKHLRICENSANNRRSWRESENRGAYTDLDSTGQNGQTQITLRKTIHDNNYNLQENVNQLSQKFDFFISKFSDYSEIQNNVNRLKTNFNKLLPEVVSRQNYTNSRLEECEKELKTYEQLKKDNDVTVYNIQEIIKELGKLTLSFNAQQNEFVNEHHLRLSFEKNVLEKIQKIQEKIEENTSNPEDVESVATNIKKCEAETNELKQFFTETKDKINSLSFDVRTINELLTECLDKAKDQDKQIFEIRNMMAQNKLDIELAEDNFEYIQGFISSRSGYIIWKIDDFEKKMEIAKSKDGILMKGPIFYSHDYGYRLRLNMFLNGLKRWRGRYMLACLQVMKGKYDDLLKWPCKIEANVILKDCENKENPKDHVRYITAKREYPNDEPEEPQESSTQYLFIPHDKLRQSKYIVNNSFFLEISVKNEKLTKHDNTL